MTPTVIIPIRRETADAIQNQVECYDEMLLEDLETATDSVIGLLREYAQEKDPRGQVYSLHEIEDLDIDSEGNGACRISFTVNIYSGCSDIDEDYDEDKEVEVSVDFIACTVKLVGETLAPVRDPDEY